MAVLFDLDGTLLDTIPDFLAATNQLLAQRQLPAATYQDLQPCISWGAKKIVETIFKLDQSHADFQDLVGQLIMNYQATNFAFSKPFPGIDKLLLDLDQANIPWGVVTNKLEYLTHPQLALHKLSDRAKCVVCGDTTSAPKPSPEPLLYASRVICVEPQDCIYIGDAKHDIIAGNAAGMYTITALYGYTADSVAALSWPANDKVTTVAEIFPLVQQWHKRKALTN